MDKFIVEHKDNNYVFFSSQLEKTDLINKPVITSSIIKYIFIKRSTSDNKMDFDKVFNILSVKVITKTNDDETDFDFDIINNVNYNVNYNEIKVDIPEPVKLSVLSTLETIHNINIVFDLIHKKIIEYNKSNFNFYKLNIKNEI